MFSGQAANATRPHFLSWPRVRSELWLARKWSHEHPSLVMDPTSVLLSVLLLPPYVMVNPARAGSGLQTCWGGSLSQPAKPPWSSSCSTPQLRLTDQKFSEPGRSFYLQACHVSPEGTRFKILIYGIRPLRTTVTLLRSTSVFSGINPRFSLCKGLLDPVCPSVSLRTSKAFQPLLRLESL